MHSTSEARGATNQAGLLGELGRMHSNSFGWALLCCNHRREEAEEVLQTAYLKLLESVGSDVSKQKPLLNAAYQIVSAAAERTK